MRFSENDRSSFSFTVRAIAQVTQIAPDIIFQDAIRQAHRLALLPADESCVCGLLEQYHFIRQGAFLERMALGELTSYMEENCLPQTAALVQLRFCGKAFFPVTADWNGKYHPAFGGQNMADKKLRSVWMRWPDQEDHSPAGGRKRSASKENREKYRTSSKWEDTPYFHFFQPNPKQNNIGDCVLRAVAGVCGISWDDALDRLASYGYAAVNYYDVYPRLMLDLGFVWHPKLTVNGRCMHGEEFCRELAALYQNGERILCEVGSGHVAAVLPRREGKHFSYQFWDSWDSSVYGDKIGDYFLKCPTQEELSSLSYQEFRAGDTIRHPAFGRGRLTGQNDKGIWTVIFESGVEKKISEEWMRRNSIVSL